MATPTFTFKSSAYGANTFTVVDFHGMEAISSLYQFDIGLKCDEGTSIDLRDLLDGTASLTMQEGTSVMNSYSGVVARVEQQQQAGGYNYYRVLLVPPAWKLGLNFRSAGFRGMTHPAIVELVLTNAGLTCGSAATAPNADVNTDDVVVDYPEQDFTCQYAESDLNFICRLLENLGIYFYFEDMAGSCRMVLADGLSYPNPVSIPFTDPSSTNNYDSIVQITQQLSAAPVQVEMTGYDYQNVSTAVQGDYGVQVDNFVPTGTYPATWLYDHRVPDAAHAARLAQVRAQESACQACTYIGSGAIPSLRAGSTFILNSHPAAAFNREYLVTSVTHTARNADQSWAAGSYTSSQTATGAYYGNSFTAMPVVAGQGGTAGGGNSSPNMQFRPQRVTPKPRISGVLSAWVYLQPDTSQNPNTQGSNSQNNDPQSAQITPQQPIPGFQNTGAGDGQENAYGLPAPPMDEQGRYLVTLPFVDGSVPDSSFVSAWIRMAQPSAGLYTGTQFMLEPGAEVLLTFVNGDPDLPVITGAVYNGATNAPLTSAATDPTL
ncbi:MAG TPA: type VI secretion system tip protein TssI/VgrG [Gammaproteobacteria bacterium]|nr:type VI secretion system tip protein TssI/VgrG [Gammaproteobacteria bacterium]